MGNGYISSYMVDGEVLKEVYGEEDALALFYNLGISRAPAQTSASTATKQIRSGRTAYFYLNWPQNPLTVENGLERAGNDSYFSFSLNPAEISARLIEAGKLAFTPSTFRIRTVLDAGPDGASITFRIMGDNTRLDLGQPAGETNPSINHKIFRYTSKPLALQNNITVRESGRFSITVDHQYNADYANTYVYLYYYPERIFDAAIPAGSGTTPVYLPGDVVPIMVRSTTDFASGDSQSIQVTYKTGETTTKTVTCSNVLARYGSQSGQYCTVLFGWTMPDDCTGGQLILSEFMNGTSQVALVGDGQHQDQTINAVNCDIDYSNRTAAFQDATIALVDATGNESADGDLALILPVKDNTISWWEWIAGEANIAMQKGGQAPFALSSMYATFGEDSEKHPIYVHTKDGTAEITVQGQKVTVDEIVDYVYIPVETGRLSAVHLHYKGYNTSDSTVPNYKEDATGFIDAYLNNHEMFYSVVSGAGYEYAVKEYNPETKVDSKPENQAYYTLTDEDEIDLVLPTYDMETGNLDDYYMY